jgi:dolichyl-phosphate beta-glucosyltransferase
MTLSDRITPPRVVIIVPCYNEARRLPCSQFSRFLSKSQINFVFVDDGSKDDTAQVLNHLRTGFEDRIVVLRNPTNKGKAEAVRHGILSAINQGVDYVGFWDADLATPLDAIFNLMRVLEERPDIDMVFGARVKLLGRDVKRRALRHYLGRLFATVVSIVLRLAIYDSQCGAKLFRVRSDTHLLFEEPFQSRWVFDVELIARYISQIGSPQAAALKIYEYPLHDWEDIAGSKVKAMDFFVALKDVAGIYRTHKRVMSQPRATR